MCFTSSVCARPVMPPCESVCADADLSPHVFSKQKDLILVHRTQ